MKAFLWVGMAAVGFSGSVASADQLTLDFGKIYSGTGVPTSGSPFARATFTSAAPGTVTLRLDGFLAPTESIATFLFNFDPGLNVSKLVIKQGGGTLLATDSPVLAGRDGHRSNGAGLFDLALRFPTVDGAKSAMFNGNDFAMFTITSSERINAGSFNFLAAGADAGLLFTAAANIRGAGAGGAWAGGNERGQEVNVVPLPAAAWAGISMLAGVAGIGAVRRRRNR